jgi:hypothetical protein
LQEKKIYSVVDGSMSYGQINFKIESINPGIMTNRENNL